MTRSPLLAGAARGIVRIAMLVAAHLLLVGHDLPGGGFVAGLVVAAALALHVGGLGRLPRRLEHGTPLLGAGLLIAVGTALVPLLLTGTPLDLAARTLDLGPAGSYKLTGALVFDVGVFLIVVGMAIAILRSLDVRSDDDVHVASGGEVLDVTGDEVVGDLAGGPSR